MEFIESETLKNLTRSFAGECIDGAKYQYIADTAAKQKLSQVSTILKALATNEMAHAKIFYELVNKESNNNISVSGLRIFIGNPGNPAPVPISATFAFIEISFATVNESTKCFKIISSGSIIAVKFIFSFHSINKFI